QRPILDLNGHGQGLIVYFPYPMLLMLRFHCQGEGDLLRLIGGQPDGHRIIGMAGEIGSGIVYPGLFILYMYLPTLEIQATLIIFGSSFRKMKLQTPERLISGLKRPYLRHIGILYPVFPFADKGNESAFGVFKPNRITGIFITGYPTLSCQVDHLDSNNVFPFPQVFFWNAV